MAYEPTIASTIINRNKSTFGNHYNPGKKTGHHESEYTEENICQNKTDKQGIDHIQVVPEKQWDRDAAPGPSGPR